MTGLASRIRLIRSQSFVREVSIGSKANSSLIMRSSTAKFPLQK